MCTNVSEIMWRDAGSKLEITMNIPTNEDERPATPIWLDNSQIRSAEIPSATRRSFEHSFCGVLVGLILAIAVILSVVAVTVARHR